MGEQRSEGRGWLGRLVGSPELSSPEVIEPIENLRELISMSEVFRLEVDPKTLSFTVVSDPTGIFPNQQNPPLLSLIAAEDVPRFQEAVKRASAKGSSGSVVEFQLPGVTTGRRIIGLLTAVSPRSLILHAADVTEGRKVGYALEVREAQLHAILESSPDVVAFLGRDGTVRYLSPSFTEVLGFLSSEIVDRRLDPFVHPDDQALLGELIAAFGESVVKRRIRMRVSGDGWAWMECRSRVISDRSGDHVGVVIVLREQSDQVKLEADLQAAKQEADRANQAKSEFLSRMSHELRTPLNAVLGFAQLLEMDASTPETKESVAQITKAGRHLLELINEILDIARIESGRISMSIEPVELMEVIAEVSLFVRPLAESRGVKMVDVEPGPERYVLADRQRLKQVLLNLLSNAIKYNKSGGSVQIRLSITPDYTWKVDIIDSGIGIPETALARLFAPFERLGAEQTEVEGTGLGLALSRRLAEAMGGVIEVTSVLGQGSVFSLHLLAIQSPLETIGGSEVKLAFNDRPLDTGRTVLYIEDSLATLKLVGRIFNHLPGVRLVTAMQGSLGSELARDQNIDLVLLDLNLPDMSGEQVLEALKKDPRSRQIPVVVISADGKQSRIDRLIAGGAIDYLVKPLDVRRLISVVGRSLGIEVAKGSLD